LGKYAGKLIIDSPALLTENKQKNKKDALNVNKKQSGDNKIMQEKISKTL